MSVNVEMIRKIIEEKGLSFEKFAREIGMDASTFYRKMKAGGASFTVGQMHKIVEVLELTKEEALSIFCFETRNNAS